MVQKENSFMPSEIEKRELLLLYEKVEKELDNNRPDDLRGLCSMLESIVTPHESALSDADKESIQRPLILSLVKELLDAGAVRNFNLELAFLNN